MGKKKLDSSKIDPRLQMVLGESLKENLARSLRSAQFATKSKAKDKIQGWVEKLFRPEQFAIEQQLPLGLDEILMRGTEEPPEAPAPDEAAAEEAEAAKREDIYANVFISLKESRSGEIEAGEELSKLIKDCETSRRGSLIAAEVPVTMVEALMEAPGVAYVETAEPLKTPDASVTDDAALERPQAPRFGTPEQQADLYPDEPRVLLGIVDVGGFDFAHPDFLKPDGTTRFDSIWDQGGTLHDAPAGYAYGSLITRDHMNRAIAAEEDLGLAAYELEPQSQMVVGSHGTHVASIAAGNGGTCPSALIAGVLVSIPKEELLDRQRSFYDSTRLAHAVEHLIDLGKARGLPVSINISLGTNGHAHDASSAINRWVDHALATPGRAISVAAGNAGQHRAEHDRDLGWMSGRIHTAGRLSARGLVQDIEWIVAGNGTEDFSENELELWYSPQDRFAVSVRAPDGTWSEKVAPGQYFKDRALPDGSRWSVFNRVYHRANGANYIAVYLSPNFGEDPPVGVHSGMWTVRLHGVEVRDGRYHGWIERDDPRRIGRIGSREYWSLPSFFSERSNVDNSSVGSLACGHNIISVGNLDSQRERMNISSSQGPTRDGRFKPETAAPGTDIVAAKGFSRGGDEPEWISMTGTSMASPYVAGIAGLLLSVQPGLTAAQIRGIIQSTAKPLPGSDYTWRNDAGYGVLDPARCLAETGVVGEPTDLGPAPAGGAA
jgi:subtilisin family serine protease